MFAFIDRLARVFAILGGLILTALIVLTCLSILGRSLNGMLHSNFLQSNLPALANWFLALGIGPINGDFELVEAAMAFAIFAFLPICQLNGAHAYVDIFTTKLPTRAQRFIRATVEVIFAGVIVLIAWQVYEGMQSKRASGQTTFLLEFPIWWSYAVSFIAAAIASVVAVYTALIHTAESMTGRVILPRNLERNH